MRALVKTTGIEPELQGAEGSFRGAHGLRNPVPDWNSRSGEEQPLHQMLTLRLMRPNQGYIRWEAKGCNLTSDFGAAKQLLWRPASHQITCHRTEPKKMTADRLTQAMKPTVLQRDWGGLISERVFLSVKVWMGLGRRWCCTSRARPWGMIDRPTPPRMQLKLAMRHGPGPFPVSHLGCWNNPALSGLVLARTL